MAPFHAKNKKLKKKKRKQQASKTPKRAGARGSRKVNKKLTTLKSITPEQQNKQQAFKRSIGFERKSRSEKARGSRKVNKKLTTLKSITPEQENKQQAFKRSIGFERKLRSEKEVSGYQPFPAGQANNCPNVGNQPLRIKNHYDRFANEKDCKERSLNDEKSEKLDKLNRESTIYVSGYEITEEFLMRVFSVIGNIVNISMETEKDGGFVTFDKVEASEWAVAEMDGIVVMASGTQLKVSLACRQPKTE